MSTLAEIETAADSLPSEENEELRCDLATQAREFAQREHITMDALVATALTAQLDHTPHRPTIAERAARVDWEKVDAILARVPAAPPTPGDERQPHATLHTMSTLG